MVETNWHDHYMKEREHYLSMAIAYAFIEGRQSDAMFFYTEASVSNNWLNLLKERDYYRAQK